MPLSERWNNLSRGNRTGLQGLFLLAAATLCQFSHWIPLILAGVALQWIAVVYCVVAAIRRPRAWLVVPLLLLCGMVYLIFFVH